MTIFQRIAAALLLFVGLTAMQNPAYGPNGNGTLLEKDDQAWLVLQDTKVTADYTKGTFKHADGPRLAKLEGKTFRITGFIMPVEPTPKMSHFIITRRSIECPFCAPPEPTETIEVVLAAPIEFTPSPITIQGQFHLVPQSENGLFYRLDRAAVI